MEGNIKGLIKNLFGSARRVLLNRHSVFSIIITDIIIFAIGIFIASLVNVPNTVGFGIIALAVVANALIISMVKRNRERSI